MSKEVAAHLNSQFAALAGAMHKFMQHQDSLCPAAARLLEVRPARKGSIKVASYLYETALYGSAHMALCCCCYNFCFLQTNHCMCRVVQQKRQSIASAAWRWPPAPTAVCHQPLSRRSRQLRLTSSGGSLSPCSK